MYLSSLYRLSVNTDILKASILVIFACNILRYERRVLLASSIVQY